MVHQNLARFEPTRFATNMVVSTAAKATIDDQFP